MSKIKEYSLYIGLFLIIWFLTYQFGAEFARDGDRKKFIFRPIEYYKEMYFWIGLVVSGAFVGYLIYKLKKEETNEN